MFRIRSLLICALLLVVDASDASGQPTPQTQLAPSSQPTSLSAAPRTTARERENQHRIRTLEKKVAQQNRDIKELVETIDEVAATQIAKKSERKIFTLHGFFDINMVHTWLQGDVIGEDLLNTDPSFVFGNLNTYYDFDLGASWRVLAEVRLLLHPVGDVVQYDNPLAGTQFERANTRSIDAMQFGSTFDRGSIEIERAQIEWNPRDWFKLTVGLFLTPFGIWNVDHGSPARLTGMIPYIYSGQFGSFPERQLGIVLSGHTFAKSLELGYTLTFSNGRGPAATLIDHDKDKAFGGRLALGGTGRVRWKVGLSAFTGRSSDFKFKMELSPRFDVKKEFTVSAHETALGADVRLDYGALSLLAEGLARWTFYDDDRRPPAVPNNPTGGLAPDFAAWGFYAAAGYRLPIEAVSLQPFFRLGLANSNDAVDYQKAVDLGVGMNWHITSNVVWRAEYTTAFWLEKDPGGPPSLFGAPEAVHAILTQLAVAFSS